MDEKEIIKKIVQKNEQAFKELYERTSAKTYYYLLGLLRDPQKAEDVMVDTYTEVWKSAHKFKGKSRLSTWIIGIARNLAMKEFSKTKVSMNTIEPFEVVDMPVVVEFLEKKDLLNKVIEKLSPAHKEILDLVFFQEMSYKEISQILNIPVNTVKTRVFYAKEKLKQILNTMGIQKDDI